MAGMRSEWALFIPRGHGASRLPILLLPCCPQDKRYPTGLARLCLKREYPHSISRPLQLRTMSYTQSSASTGLSRWTRFPCIKGVHFLVEDAPRARKMFGSAS